MLNSSISQRWTELTNNPQSDRWNRERLLFCIVLVMAEQDGEDGDNVEGQQDEYDNIDNNNEDDDDTNSSNSGI